MRYANCGHPPGLLLHGDNVEKLQAANIVVGLFEQWDCTISAVSMQEGDTLVLYTHGVIEAFDDTGEEFGEERLMGYAVQLKVSLRTSGRERNCGPGCQIWRPRAVRRHKSRGGKKTA